MIKRAFKVCLISSLVFAPVLAQAQHVWWNDPGCGDIMEMMVNASTTAPTTYYETLGWFQNAQPSGYTGIQITNSGPAIIFSLWDPPPSITRKITAPYVNPQGSFSPFGGEGTGYKYLNFGTGWSINQWYLQFVRIWQYKGDSYYGMWMYDVSKKLWTHHITMDFPMPNVSFCSGIVSFLENFGGTTPSALRRNHLTGGWKRLTNGRWVSLDKSGVDGALTNYGKASLDGYNTVFMQTGVPTTNTFSKFNVNFSNVIPPFTTTSSSPYITSQNTSFGNRTVTYQWAVNSSQNPQFSYQITLVNTATNAIVQTISDINPETRSVVFNNVTIPQQNVLVIANITDIYDISHSNNGW